MKAKNWKKLLKKPKEVAEDLEAGLAALQQATDGSVAEAMPSLESIAANNADLQALLDEREGLEEEMNLATSGGSQGSSWANDPRFRLGEIPSIREKQLRDQQWADARERAAERAKAIRQASELRQSNGTVQEEGAPENFQVNHTELEKTTKAIEKTVFENLSELAPDAVEPALRSGLGAEGFDLDLQPKKKAVQQRLPFGNSQSTKGRNAKGPTEKQQAEKENTSSSPKKEARPTKHQNTDRSTSANTPSHSERLKSTGKDQLQSGTSLRPTSKRDKLAAPGFDLSENKHQRQRSRADDWEQQRGRKKKAAPKAGKVLKDIAKVGKQAFDTIDNLYTTIDDMDRKIKEAEKMAKEKSKAEGMGDFDFPEDSSMGGSGLGQLRDNPVMKTWEKVREKKKELTQTKNGYGQLLQTALSTGAKFLDPDARSDAQRQKALDKRQEKNKAERQEAARKERKAEEKRERKRQEKRNRK
ncbi:MAG: hypothetical protein ACFB10_19100 [Salibacteraceae bacterium]